VLPCCRWSSWPASIHHLRMRQYHLSRDSKQELLLTPALGDRLCYLQTWGISIENCFPRSVRTVHNMVVLYHGGVDANRLLDFYGIVVVLLSNIYRVIETRVNVWENEKCCGNASRGRVFPQLFRNQNFTINPSRSEIELLSWRNSFKKPRFIHVFGLH